MTGNTSSARDSGSGDSTTRAERDHGSQNAAAPWQGEQVALNLPSWDLLPPADAVRRHR